MALQVATEIIDGIMNRMELRKPKMYLDNDSPSIVELFEGANPEVSVLLYDLSCENLKICFNDTQSTVQTVETVAAFGKHFAP